MQRKGQRQDLCHQEAQQSRDVEERPSRACQGREECASRGPQPLCREAFLLIPGKPQLKDVFYEQQVLGTAKLSEV